MYFTQVKVRQNLRTWVIWYVFFVHVFVNLLIQEAVWVMTLVTLNSEFVPSSIPSLVLRQKLRQQ